MIEASGTAFRSIDRNNRTVADIRPPFTPEDWTTDGLCAAPELLQLTYDSWYADPRSGEGLRALMACRACPVREMCISAAKERREKFGIWGRNFNGPETRCEAGHWITDDSLYRDGRCKKCVGQQRQQKKELVAA